MNIHLTPTSLTTKENKKKWLIYEVIRYGNFLRFAQTIKLILGIVIVWLCGLIGGWIGIVSMIVGVLIFNGAYDLFIFTRLKIFYEELPKAAFDIASGSEHDFHILMNRVENFINNEDDEKLYEALKDCYTNLQLKSDIKEAIDTIAKKLKEV